MANPTKCFIFFMMFMSSFSAYAEEEPDTKSLSPYFFIKNGDESVDSLPLKKTDTRVTINGIIADVTIVQRYTNEGTRPINASYIFPASTRAAVHGMTMTVEERVIKAKIKERQQAQKIFDDAKKAGKSASLLKQQRPNVFSMDVANILPGDTVDIELSYTELLIPEDNTYEFVYPTVVGPRYSNQPENTATDLDKWVKSPYLAKGETSETVFNISATVSSPLKIQEISCPTHKVNIDWLDEETTNIKLDVAEKNGGNRDYVIRYRLAGNMIESGVMLYEGEEENFFVLMAQPPERIQPEIIPPREYIFVIDISGSMNGFPLDTSKKLIQNLIGNLRPEDKFNVILFAGGSSVMAETSLPATQDNIKKAIDVIDRQSGGGGTEMLSAVTKAMMLPYDETMSRSILIITDGYISAEKKVFEFIDTNLGNANFFAFGIGSSVNRHLIEGISKAGRGEPFIVTDPASASSTAAKFQEYIQSPVLTNIKVKFNDFQAYSVEPVQIPDMLAQRPVMVIGKWKGAPKGDIEISGNTGLGEYKKTMTILPDDNNQLNQTLKYLWARKKIERLSDYNFSPEDQDRKSEITSIGLTYNLLTKYTSFVAVLDEIRNTNEPAKNVKQPLLLPKGVSNSAVGGEIASTPEPEFYLMVILALIIIMTSLKQKKRS